ncbi:Putative acetyltransferase [Clostridiales bacterium CHKCI006]|uniref:Acetyltransferase n=1 Tax=Candidatus Fimiplasma intestinipullorum TaxID=2840825 RepID=A0A9D1HRH2_9FIRM|nr:Putative acetyltransferase [Clostridiales bacterium CHKCI006]HIU14159.1 sugar O-acetyltransferase [Candidatus Fimiplasma intestinipullorum]
MSEKEKRDLGEWYDANFDEELLEERVAAIDLCFDLNQTRQSEREKRQQILQQLIGKAGEGLEVISPFSCDYGYHIHLGKQVFINTNCYLMDCAPITIGDHVFIGPHCGFYTASHPLNYTMRNAGLEKALPITIGSNVWFGGHVVVLPGVTIGDGCVIGAGSVVTHDIPANSVAVGSPCRVISTIDQDDRTR